MAGRKARAPERDPGGTPDHNVATDDSTVLKGSLTIRNPGMQVETLGVRTLQGVRYRVTLM